MTAFVKDNCHIFGGRYTKDFAQAPICNVNITKHCDSWFKNDTKIIYETLFKLSAVHKILKDLGTWFEFGYLSSEQADMLR